MSEYVFPVRIVNPEHGAMHVYDVGDLERHRKLGWVPEDEAKAKKPDLPAVNTDRDALIPAMSLDEMRDEGAPPAKRKPGRPRKAQ